MADSWTGPPGPRDRRDRDDKRMAQHDIERSAGSKDERALAEAALRILYERKAFEEATGMKEEHFPEGHPPPPGDPHQRGGTRGPKGHGPPPPHRLPEP